MLVIRTANRDVPLKAYVQAWKQVLAESSEVEYSEGLTGYWSVSRDEVLSQFRAGLHDRINRHIPGYGVGRKWDSDWQRCIANVARQLNTPRLIIHWLPKELKERFAHRLWEGE
ncbi:MAG: hypothetical protein GY896_22720 [Gammaproteobacteria bacterium]|nr:hypothetical protein [Gammaproteobacteria bacterium]